MDKGAATSVFASEVKSDDASNEKAVGDCQTEINKDEDNYNVQNRQYQRLRQEYWQER